MLQQLNSLEGKFLGKCHYDYSNAKRDRYIDVSGSFHPSLTANKINKSRFLNTTGVLLSSVR